ncbi:type II toxin-antitoxin system RelE/ParE family toxin [Enterobacter hormaechei]|jgi:plasmid stabilization system protein ParE|uniref:type II toxin-antitoxin system RelE/ParE family toxin n=1 Tax=Sphingobium amiense TaxID=135719 RepID=UPI000831FAAE|nr:type II toxin-antitoxin system RelE/ParE family toxin [Sphingobium amiense]MCE3544124.1 type II toxin-antitoxin system RelE/ParE family toxin [Escherichia coli]MDA4835066.1 type II toxin-antitoxin system RelE/ParE family toxin [Enterobacter hormaechei]
MKVTLSTRARRDLEGIRLYIEKDNPTRAISFVDELRDAARRIGDMSRAFPLVPRYEQHGIRRRSYNGYGILYSVQPDRVFVHRIIGPGQDHDRALRLN